MKKIIIIGTIVGFALVLSLIALYIASFPKKMPIVSIDKDALTIKQLYPYVNKYVKQYDPKRDMKIGDINMDLNKQHMGEIVFTFFEQNQKRPQIYYVNVNTKEHTIYNIVELAYNNKYSSKNLDIENWVIDSKDAEEIAIEYLEKNTGFNYDSVYLSAIEDVSDKSKHWSLLLGDSKTKMVYHIFVDPYSGKVLKSNSWQN